MAGVSDEVKRLLGDTVQAGQRILIDPSEDELRAAAERLRKEGKLYCTRCRKQIQDDRFITRRISFGPRLQAVVNLHPECDDQESAQPRERAAGSPAGARPEDGSGDVWARTAGEK